MIKELMAYVLRGRKYIFKHKFKIAVLIVLYFVVLANSLILPWMSKIIFDQVIPNKDIQLLGKITILLILLHILNPLLSGIEGHISFSFYQQLLRDIRSELYYHLQRLHMSFFHNRDTGDFTNRVTSNTVSFASLIRDVSITLPTNVLLMVATGALVWYLNWKVCMIAILFLPIYSLAHISFKKRHVSAGIERAQKSGNFSAAVQEGVSAIYVVKAFSREEHEAQKLEAKIAELIDADMKLNRIQHMALFVIAVTSAIGTSALLIAYGALEVIRGHLTLGGMVAILGWVGMLYRPINEIAHIYNNARGILGSLRRVFEVLELPTEGAGRTQIVGTDIEGSIRFEKVSFSYEQSKRVLNGVSFSVSPGEVISIAGLTGAGKTTIIDLLLGFYSPTQGKIYIGGYDIGKLQLKSLRQIIALVPQDTFLFHTSIKDNILYGNLNASDDELVRAAKAAGAHDFIMETPQGYETIVGERGITLSGGERQRIAIARAFLCDPKILLLDEATSSVDSKTEGVIQEGMRQLMKGRTTVLISHRLSSLSQVNRILVLKDGRIVETGSHEELLERGKYYRKLYEAQLVFGQIGTNL